MRGGMTESTNLTPGLASRGATLYSTCAALLLAMALGLGRPALAMQPSVNYLSANPAFQVLDVTATPQPKGTRFYIYVANVNPEAVTVYLRMAGPHAPGAVDADSWTRFDVAGSSANWVQLQSGVAATGYTLQVSFTDPKASM